MKAKWIKLINFCTNEKGYMVTIVTVTILGY